MALSKQNIDPRTGVTTNYHKISSLILRDNTLYCVLSHFVSKDYRENGNSIDNDSFQFLITIEEEESMGIRKLAYKKIKELPDWAEATDC